MNYSDRKDICPVLVRTGRIIVSILVLFLVLTTCSIANGADKAGKTDKITKTKKSRKQKSRIAKESQKDMAADAKKSKEPESIPSTGLNPDGTVTAPPPVPIPRGTVPDFSSSRPLPYSTESENQFYQQHLDRRDETLAPKAPAQLRFYTDYIIGKYDKNKDGSLQESEWQSLPGAQGIDVNGDFVLSSDEILYYIVRYSQKRTIFKPDVSIAPSRRHEVSTQGTVRLQPLSAKTKPVTKSAAKRTKTDKELADYNQEQVKKMLSDAEASVKKDESDDDLEAAERMLESVRPSQVREYAVSAVEVQGMPRWFILRDVNGDGQLSLREFAPGLEVESVAFFGKLDLNADGLVTPSELRSYVTPQK